MRLHFETEYLKITLQALLDSKGIKLPGLDAGKWYDRKPKE
jgi:hypothetical protein